jgi:hypothetical protein
MIRDEWDQLQLIEDVQSKCKSQRISTLTFSETSSARNISQLSEMHSALKKNSEDYFLVRRELNRRQNALFPIHEKCRDILKTMKVQSILKMLCNDDDIHMNMKNTNPASLSERE